MIPPVTLSGLNYVHVANLMLMVVMLVILVTMESVDSGIVDTGIVLVQRNSEWPSVTTCAMEIQKMF